MNEKEPLHTLVPGRGSTKVDLKAAQVNAQTTSFETAGIAIHDSIPISACIAALNKYHAPRPAREALAVHDKAPVEF